MTVSVLDVILACALPFIAWRALVTDELPESVVLFISLGLLSALAWTRLDAPDIALVEAAIGAGLTGALLVSSLRWIGPAPHGATTGRVARAVLALLAAGVALGGTSALLALPAHAAGLAGTVAARLPESGVSHPVTAVLLNFRSYDTLLEVAVMVEAVIAVGVRGGLVRYRRDELIGTLVAVLTRLLVPGIILAAGYLLWRGKDAPGGGFQAAALLAGGGILLILAGTVRLPRLASRRVRAVLVLGPGLFVLVAGIPLVTGGHLLAYPRAAAGSLILLLETALTFSLALVLVMFLPGPSARAASGESMEELA